MQVPSLGLACFGLLCLAGTLIADEEFRAEVTGVADGDTIHVLRGDGTNETIRFLICDAPEKDQPFGDKATEFVRQQVLNQRVTVKATQRDQYGRLLAEIITPEGKNLNRELLREGLAVWFYHYDSDREAALLEVDAKLHKRGLWSQETPIYPRNWRRGARVPEEESAGAPSALDAANQPLRSQENRVVIVAATPNPQGRDAGNETVVIGNFTAAAVNLEGWKLQDDDRGSLTLSGTLEPAQTVIVRLTETLQLGNVGDRLLLVDATGTIRDRASYTAAQATSGAVIRFGQ